MKKIFSYFSVLLLTVSLGVSQVSAGEETDLEKEWEIAESIGSYNVSDTPPKDAPTYEEMQMHNRGVEMQARSLPIAYRAFNLGVHDGPIFSAASYTLRVTTLSTGGNFYLYLRENNGNLFTGARWEAISGSYSRNIGTGTTTRFIAGHTPGKETRVRSVKTANSSGTPSPEIMVENYYMNLAAEE
ncbi:hypothetical protein [Evansella clarkii]|uniref:hypothetical protein n=1 Tax=Evansella clarkii TaxID=79879 RepID=UPI00099615BC|nr:hypothetical protein [Evansella clarkii]